MPVLPSQMGAEKIDASKEIIKYSIAARIIDTQAAAQNLFSAINFDENNITKIKAYKSFISSFKGLFISVKHNIEHSRKVPEWDARQKEYEKFFKDSRLLSIDNMNAALDMFDDFTDDLVTSGIYSILKEVNIFDVGGSENEEAVAAQS